MREQSTGCGEEVLTASRLPPGTDTMTKREPRPPGRNTLARAALRHTPAALGTSREVRTPELITEVYGVRATVTEHPESNAVQVVFTAQR